MICFNIRTEFSRCTNTVGTIDEVLCACKEKGITPAIADFNNFYAGLFLKNYLVGFSTYVIRLEDASKDKPQIFRVALYPRNASGVYALRNFFYDKCSTYYKNKKHITCDKDLKVLLQNHSNVFAVMLFSHARSLFMDNIDSVYYEWGQTDYTIRKKSVWAQNNSYALPENYIPHQIMLHDKYGRDTNEIPHILSLEETNYLGIMRGYKKFTPKDDLIKFCIPKQKKAKLPVPKSNFDLNKIKNKAIKLGKKYIDRLNYEIDILKKKSFLQYIFLVADIVEVAKKEDIIVGLGRGSAAGSLLCYLLGITGVDPIFHGLIFERFIDINRMDPPDIDLDFSDRDKLVSIIKDRYVNVCKLGTIGYVQENKSLQLTASALGFTTPELNILKTSVTYNDIDFEKKLLTSKAVQKTPEYENALSIYKRCFNVGGHAGGVIITQDNLLRYVAVDKISGCAHITKEQCDNLNLLKIDCLGVTTLKVIGDTLKKINMTYKKFSKIITTMIKHNKVESEPLKNNRFTGIFQLEGIAVKNILLHILYLGKKIDFNIICVITSIARQGGLLSGIAYEIPEKIGNKVNVPHPLLRETYGLIVYQEQIMGICKEVGKFTNEEQTFIRKAISKKKGDINTLKTKFILNGSKDYDAINLWEQIQYTGAYAFNKSHAVSYTYLSAMTLYLKHHYPDEFYSSLLNNYNEDRSKTLCINEMKKAGYELKLPQKNMVWDVKDKCIYPPLHSIKGIGEKMSKKIIKTGKVSDAQRKKIEIGISLDEVPIPQTKNNPVIQDAHPLFTELTGRFVLNGVIIDKRLQDINDEAKVEKRGKKIDISGLESGGLYITFKIYTGHHIYKVSSSFMDTTQKMLADFKNAKEKDVYTFLLEDNEIYGYKIVNYKKYNDKQI